MSFKIIIYSQNINEHNDAHQLEDLRLLNVSSIGQSVLAHCWSHDQELGRNERKYRADLNLFSTDLEPKDVFRCVDEIADLSADSWWGIVYRKEDRSALDAFRDKGARYIIPYNQVSFRNLIRQLNTEKNSNASQYFHDEDL